MKGHQFIEMTEYDHGLSGLGSISYDYCYSQKNHKLTIKIAKLDSEIVYNGMKAKQKYHKMMREETAETINLIKKISADAVGIPVHRLKEKSRKKEVVWARNMVMWYVKMHLKHTYAQSGELFGKDHATAIHAMKEFNKDNKYLTSQQSLWKSTFIKKCRDKNLI